MGKYDSFFSVICIALLLFVGCGKQEDIIYSDNSSGTEKTEYALDDFDRDNLQEVENHGLILKVPKVWEISVTEKDVDKSIIINFEHGVMSIIVTYSNDELNLKDFSDDYKSLCTDESMFISDSREETFDNQKMEVFDWNDEVNGNRIHGTTYLFVTQHLSYNISFSTYAEISYEKELSNIMDTFIYDESVVESIPFHIMELFNQYEAIISSGDYDIHLGEKIGIDDSEDNCTYYRISLCPSDTDIVSYPCVQFYSNNEYTDKSFSIDNLEYCSNSVVKEIIFCTLAATNPDMTMDAISELQTKLVNSYNGYGQSEVIETETYKYFIRTDPHFNGMYFEIVAKEEINIPVKKELYSEYSINEMQAELNVGEKAVIKGIVEYEEFDWLSNTLCITNNDKKYYVHYTPKAFPGEFCKGIEYVFYGTISTECDTESGCLRLDYYEIIDDLHNETDNINEITFNDLD